jgi:hypothetical protein
MKLVGTDRRTASKLFQGFPILTHFLTIRVCHEVRREFSPLPADIRLSVPVGVVAHTEHYSSIFVNVILVRCLRLGLRSNSN